MIRSEWLHLAIMLLTAALLCPGDSGRHLSGTGDVRAAVGNERDEVMATRIIVFDPLLEAELRRIESELDTLLNSGWQMVTAFSGNRTGTVPSETYTSPLSSVPVMPTFKDYVVLILHKTES